MLDYDKIETFQTMLRVIAHYEGRKDVPKINKNIVANLYERFLGDSRVTVRYKNNDWFGQYFNGNVLNLRSKDIYQNLYLLIRQEINLMQETYPNDIMDQTLARIWQKFA